MRIKGLHIDGFGVWRELTVEGIPNGMTVFYGRNEAGTARAKYWRPAGADLTAPRARGGIQKECPNRPNRPHSPKASQRFELRPICPEVSGKDSSDSKDSVFTSPRARQENLADWMSA